MTAIVTPTPTAVASPSARRGKSFYRPELDVLRFFAFFSVFLYHFWRPTELYVQHGVPRIVAVLGNGLIQGGVFGVDLFFVLSAYLITELLLREKDECGSLDVRGFYLRRILRIWPLYFFYIGLALLPIFNQRHGFTWHHAAAFVLLAGNWSVIAWGWPSPSIVVPLWTVSIEEQFYLAWPPIVRRLSRSGIAWAAVGMLVVSNATRIAMVALHGGMNSVWCNTFSRLDPIVAGILIALVLRGRIPNFNPVLRAVMLACGIVPLALVSNYWHIHEPQRLEWIPTLVGFPVVAVSCSLIMLAVLGVSLSMPRFLVYLGKISYGLYVYHPLGNLLSGEVMRVHSSFLQLALRPIAALATTVLLAAASYAFLEKPFLRLKQRFAHIDSRPV
jgi:peptidoglycan/LPS O-acetylase OafA/YrhL